MLRFVECACKIFFLGVSLSFMFFLQIRGLNDPPKGASWLTVVNLVHQCAKAWRTAYGEALPASEIVLFEKVVWHAQLPGET